MDPMTDVVLGGADVLALFVLGWDVARCMRSFASLAHGAFRPRAATTISAFTAIHRWVQGYLSDSLYPAHGIDRALSLCFGIDTVIDDGRLSAAQHGIAVAVTTATLPETDSHQPHLITSYNGVGRRASTSGKRTGNWPVRLPTMEYWLTKTVYDVIQPSKHPQQIRLWER